MLNCCTNIVFNILYYSLFHNNEYILIKLFTTESIIMVIGSLNLEIISHKIGKLIVMTCCKTLIQKSSNDEKKRKKSAN